MKVKQMTTARCLELGHKIGGKVITSLTYQNGSDSAETVLIYGQSGKTACAIKIGFDDGTTQFVHPADTI